MSATGVQKSPLRHQYGWACLAMLLCVWVGASAQEPRKSSGDRELLRLVAKQAKANREAILTWTGKVNLEDRYSAVVKRYKNEEKSRSIVSFAYDRAAKKSVFRFDQTEPVAVSWGGIRTAEGFFSASVWTDDPKRAGRSIPTRPTLKARPLRSMRRGTFSPDFDPFYYLETDGIDIHKQLMFVYDNWNNEKMSDLDVKREGNLVTLTMSMSDISNRYVFDLDQGGNVVKVDHKSGTGKSDQRRSYVKIADVWLPKSTHAKNVDSGEKPSTTERQETWEHQVLNEPVPADSFRPEAVGVKKGDTVRNSITKREYKYNESGLPDVSPTARRFWIVANVVVAVAVLAALAAIGFRLARRRKPRGEAQ